MNSFYLFEILSVVYLIGALAFVPYLIKKYRTNLFKGILLPIFLFLGLVLLLKIQIEPYQIAIRKQTIKTGKIQNEVKVALLGDIHLRPLKSAWFLEKTAQKVIKEKPDLIVITGDFLFFDHVEKYASDFSIFKKFSEIAPTYAVLGNHDYGIVNSRATALYKDQHEKIKKLLENAGVRVLVDENTKIEIAGEKIQLIGFDEFWHISKKPSQAIQWLDSDGLKIGLSHNPDAAYLPESQNFDILLSGHTHGGQMRLPLIGSLAEAETTFPRVEYGKFIDAAKPKILNTVGMGESGLPIRFFNHPEIVILNIK